MPRFLLCTAFPPPYSGEETLGLTLKQAFEEMPPSGFSVSYFDISSKHSNAARGRLSFSNAAVVLKLALRFVWRLLRERPQGVYIPLAQNRFGFAKYSLFIWLAALWGCRVVALLGGANFHHFYARETFWVRWWIRQTLKKNHRLIVQGEALRQQFDGLFDPEKIRVVGLGIDPKNFQKESSAAGGFAEREGEKKPVEVLFVGALSKAKGVLDLLAAVPAAAAACPGIHFHLVGEILDRERNILQVSQANNRESIRQRMADPSVKPHITYHGLLFGEKKLKLFQQCEICVLPSYSESFPFVLLEAAAAGLALIGTKVGSNPEIYREGENILYVPAGDVEKLVQALVTLARDGGLRRKMGANNLALIRSHYTHLHFAGRMQQVFAEVLSEAFKRNWGLN